MVVTWHVRCDRVVQVSSSDRFAVRVRHDGQVLVEIGQAFTEDDIPALVTAQRAVSRMLHEQETRPALTLVRGDGSTSD